MKTQVKPIAFAVAVAFGGGIASTHVYAQDAKVPTTVIEVTGIRASMEKSLETKRANDAQVEVISAEDVGKMPDKNLADSLQRLPTIAVRTDYDEAEKVSMRGTNPDMSLIVFNGHTVSGGDWYIADQQSSSRSTSLSLIPSSVLSQAIVYRTSQANIVDGGLAGTINVSTPKPLARKQSFGGVVSVGAVYADLADKVSPDISAVVNWKNEENTFGIIAQGFAEKRHIRRDSVTTSSALSFGWSQINTATFKGITDASLAGTGLKAADLHGVRIPSALGAEFVEGVRDRQGGVLALQWRPTKDLDMTLTMFQSDMNANNYGRSAGAAIEAMLNGTSFFSNGRIPVEPATGTRPFAYIKNPVIATEKTVWGPELKYLKSAEIVFPDGSKPAAVGSMDNSYRDGATASSGFTDFDFKYKVNDRLVVKGLLSTTEGRGETKEDQGIGWYRFGSGVSYELSDTSGAPKFSFINAGSLAPVPDADGRGFQAYTQRNSRSRTIDKENAIALNAEYDLDWKALTTLDAGVRYADHSRDFQRWVYTRKRKAYDALPTDGFKTFPDDLASAIGSGFDNKGFYYDEGVIQGWIDSQFKSLGDSWDRLMSSAIDMQETQSAVYVMQNFENENFSGNFGVRGVRTKVNANIINRLPANLCPKIEPGKPVTPCEKFPAAIVDASDLYNWYEGDAFNPYANAPYYFEPTKREFWNLLPSFNGKLKLTDDMYLKLAVSKTVGRQNYNVWGSGVSGALCKDGVCTVNGPNPNLKPMTSENFDFNWSWYFARRSLISLSYFESDIQGYTKFGNEVQPTTIDLTDPATGEVKPFFVRTAGQQGAKIKGFDVTYEQPIASTGFGVMANVSQARTKVDDGRPMTGASEWAWNLGGYYENDFFSARLVFNYRDDYVSSATAPPLNGTGSTSNTTIQGVTLPPAHTWSAPVTNVAFSANYKFNKNLEAHFSATNLTNPVRSQYRYSENEVQFQSVSGRQYYFNVKYKF